MDYLTAIFAVYVSIGFGFALASWLQAAEIEVNETGVHSAFFSKALLWFVFGWSVFAIYCYRAEVSRTIEKIDLSKFDKD